MPPDFEGLPAMEAGPVFRLTDHLGHGDCGGWTVDGRDGVLVCACGTELRSEGDIAA